MYLQEMSVPTTHMQIWLAGKRTDKRVIREGKQAGV